MNAAELTQRANGLVGAADAADAALRKGIVEHAEAERLYRKARAEAWVTCTGTAKEKEDQVNAATADHRFARDVAEGMRRADLELVRRRQTEISMLQSLMAAHRAEAEISSYGPRVGA